jgi:hypothetical protein
VSCITDWLTIAWATLILCNCIVTPVWVFRLVWNGQDPHDFPERLYATLCGACAGISVAILVDAILRVIFVFAERASGC